MPYSVAWFRPNHVIQLQLIGSVTLDEAKQINAELVALLDQAESPIHMIADATTLESFPKNILQIKNTQAYLQHPQLGWILFVSKPNPLIRFFATTVAQVIGTRLRMVETISECVAILDKISSNMNEIDTE